MEHITFVLGDKDTDILCHQKEFSCRQKWVVGLVLLFTHDDKKSDKNTLLSSSVNGPLLSAKVHDFNQV